MQIVPSLEFKFLSGQKPALLGEHIKPTYTQVSPSSHEHLVIGSTVRKYKINVLLNWKKKMFFTEFQDSISNGKAQDLFKCLLPIQLYNSKLNVNVFFFSASVYLNVCCNTLWNSS